MKGKPMFSWLIGLVVSIVSWGSPFMGHAKEIFITIGGGDPSGVYFPAGLSIARMLNSKRTDYGIRATVEATSGSTFNLNAIAAGYLEFGLAQSDTQYKAVNGLAKWKRKGPRTELRSVFSIHREALTLVAAGDSRVESIADLKGKRVSTGNPGSSQHRIVMDALVAAGLDPVRDIVALKVAASEAPALLQDRRIDAYFFTVGHPSETIRRALSGDIGGRLIPITGPNIDRLLAQTIPYVATTIPVMQLYPEVGAQGNVATFGVIATLNTSSKVPADVVYRLTKEVFENLAQFREEHPAFYQLTKAGMLQGLSAPLHAGALRYFKESGLIR